MKKDCSSLALHCSNESDANTEDCKRDEREKEAWIVTGKGQGGEKLPSRSQRLRQLCHLSFTNFVPVPSAPTKTTMGRILLCNRDNGPGSFCSSSKRRRNSACNQPCALISILSSPGHHPSTASKSDGLSVHSVGV